MRINRIITGILIMSALSISSVRGQISPGDLSTPHAHLEGMSNCTQCHTLGDKVSNEKCLQCHSELKDRIDLNKGYHVSSDVKTKECVVCHNDHHGRNFQIVRFSETTFNHDLTGYKLEGAHSGKECKACHKPEFIQNQKVKSKKYTYLGLDPACLNCHEDYHQKTLSTNCAECHNFTKFKPADKFDHNRSNYPLLGMHKNVECGKCHKITTLNGKEFREFKGIAYTNCTSCHKDVHNNQFGQDCRSCHSEESFHIVKGMDHFDHSKTTFPLSGKHQAVNCKSCHKTNLTDPLKHENCFNCHLDYHKGEFVRNGINPDCSVCHSVEGFTIFSFTIEQHNEGEFKLEGSHMATPCFACHKKEDRWAFRNIGMRCNDCHKDIHQTFLDPKYYPEQNCMVCHTVNAWQEVSFDHSKTQFALLGAHKNQSCRSCHFKKDEFGTEHQSFTGLSTSCTTCHKDAHHNQFEEKGIKDCRACHESDNWKPVNFDHSKTRFKLDGAHANIACNKCHKEVVKDNSTYIQYTYKDFKCETCHH